MPVMKRKMVSAITLTLLLTSILTLAFNIQPVKASGSIYIRADGSVDPPTAPISTVDNVIYTLTGNITSDAWGVVVERSNIIIDGNGHMLQGTGIGYGFNLTSVSNVTIKSIRIIAFTYCVYLNESFNTNLFGNYIADNGVGIYIGFSSGNSIIGNHLTASRGDGSIYLYYSSRNTINGNNLTSTSSGIYLGFSSNNSIYSNTITQIGFMSIRLFESTNNIVAGNKIIDNERCGISISGSAKNFIINNTIINNPDGGIRLGSIVYDNGTTTYSRENTIIGNTISNSGEGIALWYSDANIIYHNNFVNNPYLVYTEESYNNVWDNGYPSGGNYWSDYTGVDADGDGIGDTPYVIDAENQDRYPLMHPWSSLPVHNINTGLGYATIQEAINAPETLDGHTIFVEAGTYHEHVIVNKTHLSLFGESGKTIVDGDGTGSVIYAEATGVNISGFTIQHGTGGVVNWGGFAFISNNTIIHCSYGIYFERSAYSNTIINNTIRLNNYGICIPVDAYGTSIYNNKLMDNNYGISISPPSGWAVRDTIISGNVIANNRIGIELWGSDSGTIIGNQIANNTDYGIDVNYCTNNKIYHNNFINNGIQAHLWSHNSQNFWDDGYPSGGNYWSDYVGVDVKSGPAQDLHGSDGIGDTPYTIDADNVDHYPLTNPYGAPLPPTCALTITATVGGTTDPTPGTYSYTANSAVEVSAIPNANYLFNHWELDSVNVGSANPYTILMSTNHLLKAVFSPISPPKPPVGGYSILIQAPTTEKPLSLYLAIMAILTAAFTTVRHKTHKRRK
jgi:parallel beta-helix repeat protein